MPKPKSEPGLKPKPEMIDSERNRREISRRLKNWKGSFFAA